MIGIVDSLVEQFFRLFLLVDQFLVWAVSVLYSMFEVFAGIRKVTRLDAKGNVETVDYLINMFFFDKSINTIYWGMAGIGIVLSFGFAMYALIKKIFDIDDKIKTSLGGILGNLFKSVLSIIILNFMVVSILTATNVLMQRMVSLFDNADLIGQGTEITFDESDYATMARILNTIGNYSLNPARNSKYNINACFNEIRNDMLTLQKKGAFNFTYRDYEKVKKEGGEEGEYTIVYKTNTKRTWQYELVRIAVAHNLSVDQPIDVYDEQLTNAIIDCMDDIEKYRDLAPLQKYTSPAEKIGPANTPIDAIIFLSGTLNAAKNTAFNQNPSIFDSLRYEYIRPGGKDIQNQSQVMQDFKLADMSHLTIIIVSLLVGNIFLSLNVNCVARIFNMLLLYIIAPPFFATTPLDRKSVV